MSNDKTVKQMKTQLNFKITKTGYFGRYDGDHNFELTVNDRWFITVIAEVLDTNEEELEINIVNIQGAEGDFEPKLKYESAILDAIADYCNADDETFRDSPDDWAEYYAELNADAARYM